MERKISQRNRRLALRLPAAADLPRIIDWRHPLLRNRRENDPAARLLAAWRANPGYRYYFDRSEIDTILRNIPEHDWQVYERTLACFLPRGAGGSGEEGPVPRLKGRFHWNCHTPGNVEKICAVNRLQWMRGAAAAARRNGSVAAAVALFGVMDDWIRGNPIPVALVEGRESPWGYWYHPWAPSNVSDRVKNWLATLHLLWDSPALTPERFGRYVRALREHMIFLARVTPRTDRRATGTHILDESATLILASILPWLRESRRARAVGLANFERCLSRQLLPDGVHSSRAANYHRGCLSGIGMALLLCRLNRFPFPARYFDLAARALEFSLHVIHPDGACAKFGDSSPTRDGWQHEQLLARLTGRALPVKVPPASGWLPFLRNLPSGAGGRRRPFALARHFPYGGFAAARGSWRPDASAVLMSLGGYGGGHSHGDFLSFILVWRGRLIVDERGVWAYNHDRKSAACKSAAAHNVLLLGRRDLLRMGSDLNYWARRPPAVRIADVRCRTWADGRLIAGGRVVWPDGAWWRRELSFDPRRGVRLQDEFSAPGKESARLQFYVRATNLKHESPTAYRTSDRGQPNVRFVFSGDPIPNVRASAGSVCEGFFVERPATRLVASVPPRAKGCWQTIIEGV